MGNVVPPPPLPLPLPLPLPAGADGASAAIAGVSVHPGTQPKLLIGLVPESISARHWLYVMPIARIQVSTNWSAHA